MTELYGLRLAAPWDPQAEPDVSICIDPAAFDNAATLLEPRLRSEPFAWSHIAPNRVFLHWSGLVEAIVDTRAQRITLHELGPQGIDAFRSHLLGIALAVLLNERGTEVWHGTAVGTAHDTLVIMGDSGSGKSTLAAGFLVNGWRVITDDLVILDRRGTQWYVRAGPPRLKLFPDLATKLLPDERASMRLNPFTDKRAYELSVGESGESTAPVSAIVVLAKRGEGTALERMSGNASAKALLANVFSLVDKSPRRLEALLGDAAALTAAVPVFSATVQQADASELPALAARLWQEVQRALHADAEQPDGSQQVVQRE